MCACVSFNGQFKIQCIHNVKYRKSFILCVCASVLWLSLLLMLLLLVCSQCPGRRTVKNRTKQKVFLGAYSLFQVLKDKNCAHTHTCTFQLEPRFVLCSLKINQQQQEQQQQRQSQQQYFNETKRHNLWLGVCSSQLSLVSVDKC